MPTPGLRGGNTSVVTTSAGSVLVGTINGWRRSTDAGYTWHEISPSLSSVFSAHDETLWAGSNSGVMQSTDDGRTWSQVGLTDYVVPRVVKVGDSTLIALLDLPSGWPSDSLVFSSDAGASWQSAKGGLDDIWEYDTFKCRISMLEAVNDNAYFGTEGCGPLGSGGFVATWDDEARQWKQVPAKGRARTFTGIAADRNGRIWATTVASYEGGSGGLFREQDDTLRVAKGGAYLATLQDASGLMLAASATGLSATTDGTTLATAGLDGLPVASLTMTSDSILYAGTSTYCYPALDPPISCNPGFGAFVRRTVGGQWEPIDAGNGAAGVVGLVTNSDGVLVGTANGLWRLEDPHGRWIPVATGSQFPHPGNPDSLRVPFVVGFSGVSFQFLHQTGWGELFASGGAGRVLFRYDESVQRWIGVGPQLGYLHSTLDIASRAPETLLVSANGRLSASHDGGESWSTSLDKWVAKLGTTPDGTFLAAADSLHRSVDGLAWSVVADAPAGIRTFATGRGDSLFAVAADDALFLSSDQGRTWDAVGTHPDLAEMLVDNSGTLFGRTSRDVFTSNDDGQSWQSLSLGLPDRTYLLSIVIDRFGYLYAGTDSRGVLRTSAPVSVGVSEDSQASNIADRVALSVYPTPFRSHTDVVVTVEHPANLSVELFDALGRHVHSVAAGLYQAGTHRFGIAGGRLAPGLYLVRVSVDGETQTRSVIRM